MSHRKLPLFSLELIAELESSGTTIGNRSMVANIAKAPELLQAIAQLADDPDEAGGDLLQTIKLWRSSHRAAMHKMQACSCAGPNAKVSASASRPRRKTFAEMTGPERASLKKSDPASYERERTAWRASLAKTKGSA